MFMHQTWKESRLKLPDDIFEEGDDYVTLPPEFFENLWQPDPYFLNSKVAGKCFDIIVVRGGWPKESYKRKLFYIRFSTEPND